MAISSTPSGYSNGCTGRLAAAITTTTSTGITVTADSFKTPAGTGATTWPTGNQIWKVSRKTRTNTLVEYLGIESLSQSGTALTTGTVIRYLSPTDGTSFVTVGAGLSFPAGSVVELVWDVRHAEQTMFKDNVNTITGAGAIRSSSTTVAAFRPNSVTEAQRDAAVAGAGDSFYVTDGSNANRIHTYEGGSWGVSSSTTVADMSTTVAGKGEAATTAEHATAAATGGTGATLVVPNSSLVKTSSGAGDENKIPVLGESGTLPIGMIATGTPTGSKFVRDDGTLQPVSVGFYGDGSDGAVTLGTNTTLTRDMYYSSLDLSTYTLNTAGFRVYVNGLLTGTGKIKTLTGGNGGNAATGYDNRWAIPR